MSFFGNQNTGPAPMTVAKIEAEVMTDMFNKMVISCFKKCVSNLHDGELSVGEMTCTDRCVGKYMMAQEKVGKVLQDFEAKTAAQAQAQQQLGQPPRKF